jgi:hypothetical protein
MYIHLRWRNHDSHSGGNSASNPPHTSVPIVSFSPVVGLAYQRFG